MKTKHKRWIDARARWRVRRRAELIVELRERMDREWFRRMYFGDPIPDGREPRKLEGILSFIHRPETFVPVTLEHFQQYLETLTMNPTQRVIADDIDRQRAADSPVRVYIPKERTRR